MSGPEVRAIAGPALAALPKPPAQFILYFEHDSVDLTTESRALLEKVIGTIRDRAPVDVSVVGHTDTVGTKEYNYSLSMKRARAVAVHPSPGRGSIPPSSKSRPTGRITPSSPPATRSPNRGIAGWRSRSGSRRVERPFPLPHPSNDPCGRRPHPPRRGPRRLVPAAGRFHRRERLRLLSPDRPPEPGVRPDRDRGSRRGESRTPRPVAMAAVPDRTPPRTDSRGRRDRGGARHGVRRTRPDVPHAPLRGDPAGPRGADRPRGPSAGGAGHRPGPRSDARRGSLRPRLPVRLRNGAGERMRPSPPSRGGSRRRRNGRRRRPLRCPGGRLQPARAFGGGRLLRLFQRHPRPGRSPAPRSPGDPPQRGALPEPRPGALPEGPGRRRRPGNGTGGGRGAASRREAHPPRPPRQPAGELSGTPPDLSPPVRRRGPRGDRGPCAVEGEDRPARDHRRRAQGDPHHAARRRPPRCGNPRQRPRQPAFGRPDRGPAMGAGGEGPPRPVPRVPADRSSGAVQRRVGTRVDRAVRGGDLARVLGTPRVPAGLPSPAPPGGHVDGRLHGPHLHAVPAGRPAGPRAHPQTRAHAGRHHPEPGRPDGDPAP